MAGFFVDVPFTRDGLIDRSTECVLFCDENQTCNDACGHRRRCYSMIESPLHEIVCHKGL